MARAAAKPVEPASQARSTGNPAPLDTEEQGWLDGFVEHVEALPPDRRAAFERLAAARSPYGEDFDRELADLEAGRHPLQQR